MLNHKIDIKRIKKIIFIYAAIIVLSCSIYKVTREVIWVKRYKANVDENIQVSLKIDDEILVFLDPVSKKNILMSNKITGNKIKISFSSLEPNIEFYIDTFNGVKSIIIKDNYWGYNAYDYNTFRLLNKKSNFMPSQTSGQELLSTLKSIPKLIYDDSGLHNF